MRKEKERRKHLIFSHLRKFHSVNQFFSLPLSLCLNKNNVERHAMCFCLHAHLVKLPQPQRVRCTVIYWAGIWNFKLAEKRMWRFKRLPSGLFTYVVGRQNMLSQRNDLDFGNVSLRIEMRWNQPRICEVQGWILNYRNFVNVITLCFLFRAMLSLPSLNDDMRAPTSNWKPRL